MENKKLIIITGPTASGKSALAVSLAKKIDTEIINADSRQIYKGIPISTATPSEEEKGGICHHLLDFLPLDSYYSASLFRDQTNDILKKIFNKKETAIVCGGSMLYIDALVNGIDELPTVPDTIRQSLMNDWKNNDDQWLLNQLLKYDPDYYEKVDKNNLKRVFHAIEISITANRPYSSMLTGRQNLKKSLPYKVIKICLDGSRAELFDRINNRVLKMIDAGLENEALKVYPLRHLNSLNTVGLKEMFEMFEGRLKREEVIARIQKNTRVYAKKQLTWHKKNEDLIYLDFSNSIERNVGFIKQELLK